MRYEDLKNAIQSCQADVSADASTILDYVLDRFEEGQEDIDIDEVYDAIRDECDNYFIYYSDAWNYLEDNCITDFDEAISNCCTSVCSIAYFYAEQEILDNLNLEGGDF